MRTHRLGLTVALLACSALAVCPGTSLGQTATPPVFESVVVGTPIVSDLAMEDRAASASVITQDRTPRASESVTQILDEQAGATVTRLGGMGSTATLSLRGSAPNQVLVYVDRVPFNSATGGGVDLAAIPIGDVSRIEVYRGMSPIAFGASAIGGVVSVTTEIPKQNRVDMDVGGGSFGTYYGGAKAAFNRGRFHAYAGVHLQGSDGDFQFFDNNRTPFDTTDDRRIDRRNNDLQQVDGTLRTVVDLSPERHVGASFVFFDRDQGLPGPPINVTPVARLASSRSTGILSYQSSSDLGQGGDLRATGYGSYARHQMADPAGQILGVKGTDTHDRTVTGGLTVDWRKLARDWFILSGVLDGRVDRFRPSDSGITGAPATRYFGAVGLEGDLWIEPWRFDVIASARIEAALDETSGRDNLGNLLPTSQPASHVLPIGRLSLVKQLGPSLSLRANGGRYARLPSTIELYGNTGFLLGSPGLRPESGINVDLGPQLHWKNGVHRVLWSAAGFASFVDDLIQLRPAASGPVHVQNLGKARILGVETDATVELGSFFRGFASATFTDGRDQSANETHHGQPLPLRPRYRLYVRPEVRNLAFGAHVKIGAYADVDATDGNYWSQNGTAKVDRRLLFGAGIFVDLPLHFSVRFSARNLGNSSVNDYQGYPLPGREVYLTLLWSSQKHPNKEPLP